MGRYCLLCRRKSTKDNEKDDNKVSYYKFPKDIVRRKIWLKFCHANESDITSSATLCHKHFKKEDFMVRAGDDRKILKTNSLPFDAELDEIEERLSQETSGIHSNNLSYESYENPVLIKEKTNVDVCETSESTVTKPLERLIRYVGDINTSHLQTPRKAEIALSVAKKTISEQRRKIKTLQQTTNRLRQHLSCLKDLVEQLKRKNLIGGNAAKILMVRMSHITRNNKIKENS